MTRHPSAILSPLDLPLAELCAARLDGELFRVDHAFAPVDEIEQPRHRARALRTVIPDRMIAEQLTAAWIWGALDDPPSRHQLCAPNGARVRSLETTWLSSREVVIDDLDVATIEGLAVTTMLRTALDLGRFSASFADRERRVVSWLMVNGGFGVEQCRAELDRRRNLPAKRRALERLSGICPNYPEFTLYTS